MKGTILRTITISYLSIFYIFWEACSCEILYILCTSRLGSFLFIIETLYALLSIWLYFRLFYFLYYFVRQKNKMSGTSIEILSLLTIEVHKLSFLRIWLEEYLLIYFIFHIYNNTKVRFKLYSSLKGNVKKVKYFATISLRIFYSILTHLSKTASDFTLVSYLHFFVLSTNILFLFYYFFHIHFGPHNNKIFITNIILWKHFTYIFSSPNYHKLCFIVEWRKIFEYKYFICKQSSLFFYLYIIFSGILKLS